MSARVLRALSLSRFRASASAERPAKASFTLIELLVVVAIIGVLASMLLPTLSRARDRAQETLCSGNLKQILMAASIYTDGQYIIPSVLGDSGNYWDNILYTDEKTVDLQVLRCPKADRNSQVAYTDATFGKVVNSAFRQSKPASGPNSNYWCNGGWQGGGNITVPKFGTGGSALHSPYRYIVRPGQPGVAQAADGSWRINGYTAFFEPLNASQVLKPDSTVGFYDGGFSQADFIAPRHGGGCSSTDVYALGNRFNVAWMDGHVQYLESGSPTKPWQGHDYKLWTHDD